jgi:hypothetical protein
MEGEPWDGEARRAADRVTGDLGPRWHPASAEHLATLPLAQPAGGHGRVYAVRRHRALAVVLGAGGILCRGSRVGRLWRWRALGWRGLVGQGGMPWRSVAWGHADTPQGQTLGPNLGTLQLAGCMTGNFGALGPRGTPELAGGLPLTIGVPKSVTSVTTPSPRKPLRHRAGDGDDGGDGLK